MRRYVKRYPPRRSVRIESTGPELSAPTRWIVTTRSGTGTSPVNDGRTTRPSTTATPPVAGGGAGAFCAASGAAQPDVASSAAPTVLRIELPEVFGPKVLKIGLEL